MLKLNTKQIQTDINNTQLKCLVYNQISSHFTDFLSCVQNIHCSFVYNVYIEWFLNIIEFVSISRSIFNYVKPDLLRTLCNLRFTI